MPTAEDVLSETFSRFTKNWTFITSLRQFGDVTFPIAEEVLAHIHTDYIERIAVDPEYKKIIVKFDGSESDWDEDMKKLMRSGMTELVVTNARAGIDAACLVFAQSILEDCAWAYLRTCALASPADWDTIISEKKVSFIELSGKKPEEIREEMINEKLEQLERESLLKKVDLLFRLCPPPLGFSPINNYAYDRDRVERIDLARQAIIHRDGLGKQVPNIDLDLEFISKTANYLMALVNHKYGVQLNILKVFNLKIPPEILEE
jgi:hypothetical protein